MKLAIIGATGKQGKLLYEEALGRGIDVTAIVRHPEKLNSDQKQFLKKDLFDLTTEDLKPFNVVIDAFNAPHGQEELHVTAIKHLIAILKNTSTRLLVVGGAGSLFVDEDKKIRLFQTPDFPDAYKPTAINMGKGLELLEDTPDVRWTYVSPAAFFNFEGAKTGYYSVAGDNLMMNSQGNSEISYADYAIAMIDEAVSNEHPNQRISVVSK